MVRYRSPSSSQSLSAIMDASAQFHFMSPSTTADQESELLSTLRALHTDEFVYLSRNLTGFQKRCEESWVIRSFGICWQYLLFHLQTWVKAMWAFLFFPTTLVDRLAIFVLSIAACIVMSILLPWCLLCNIPYVGEMFDHFSRKMCNGLSIVNASYPTIFEELTPQQIAAARKHLSQPIEESNRSNKRVFNLDAAKLLLQCASLMYERTARTTHRAASKVHSYKDGLRRRMTASDTPHPGSRIEELCGIEGAQAVSAELHEASPEENTIMQIARDNLGLQYTTISEMNSVGSAFCGLFWDPNDTFIIVAFKGTTPTDFAEWGTDFTFQMRDAGMWLRGFGKVHSGFLQKVFPTRINSGSRLPYDTINEAVQTVADRLSRLSPSRPINVWFTGHSLGCALSSLVYSYEVMEDGVCGDTVTIRDAYLFAAPIVCDVGSANAFNNRMNHFHDKRRTMWRITNGRDIVATGLPDLGDRVDLSLSPWNLFSFAHLGCEVKLRNAPGRCLVKGSHITPGTHVAIESAIHLDSLEHQETRLQHTLQWLQQLPVIGRVLAHGTGFYWAALQNVGAGTCEWVFD